MNYKETLLEETVSDFYCFKEVFRKKKIEIDGQISEQCSWSYSYPECKFGYTNYHKQDIRFYASFNHKPSLQEVIDKYAHFMRNEGMILMGKKLDNVNT